MSRYEATFEIDSKTDARAVRLLAEQMYDLLREELRELDHGDTPQKEILEQFESIREAAREQSPGTLTITYESRGEAFDE